MMNISATTLPIRNSHHAREALKIHKIAIISIAICSILTGTIGLYSSKLWAQGDKTGDGKPSATASKPALTVQTIKPQEANLSMALNANGSIAAWQEAIVGAEVNGLRLSQVLVGVGDVVKRGQVLATFASESVQADVAQAQASLAEAQASAAEGRANAERARSLQDSGALSAQQITQFLTAEQATAARVQAAKATLASQNLRLKNAVVRAPDSGTISARMATLGAVAAPGQELFRLIRQNRLEWRADVTASEAVRIQPGHSVQVVTASGDTVAGKVRMLAPTVDTQTRNTQVFVDVPSNSALKAGMFARGAFALGSSKALTLPASALVLRDGFTYVFRVEPTNKVVQIKLQTGRRSGDRVEVQGTNVKTDQNFVASGAAFLADGDTVRVVAAAATATK